MAKPNKEEQARREGMAYALQFAKAYGIEALEKELRFRNATRLPVAISTKVCEEEINHIKMNAVDTISILAAVTLRDEFGFAEKRIKRFVDRFNLKTDCLAEGYTTWEEQIEILREECGLEFIIRRTEDF